VLTIIATIWCYATGIVAAVGVFVMVAVWTIDHVITGTTFAKRVMRGAMVDAKIRRKEWQLVPWSPTHDMERAYFTAPLPEHLTGISATQRHKRNRMKMEARWASMLAAAPKL
jgi:hypothetical protein